MRAEPPPAVLLRGRSSDLDVGLRSFHRNGRIPLRLYLTVPVVPFPHYPHTYGLFYWHVTFYVTNSLLTGQRQVARLPRTHCPATGRLGVSRLPELSIPYLPHSGGVDGRAFCRHMPLFGLPTSTSGRLPLLHRCNLPTYLLPNLLLPHSAEPFLPTTGVSGEFPFLLNRIPVRPPTLPGSERLPTGCGLRHGRYKRKDSPLTT